MSDSGIQTGACRHGVEQTTCFDCLQLRVLRLNELEIENQRRRDALLIATALAQQSTQDPDELAKRIMLRITDDSGRLRGYGYGTKIIAAALRGDDPWKQKTDGGQDRQEDEEGV